MTFVCVVCCQAEVSVSGRSLVQRSLTECGMSECDREATIMWKPWPAGKGWGEGGGCCVVLNNSYFINIFILF